MKKFVSLMVSVMMLINPFAGVLAEGEQGVPVGTETNQVTVPETGENTEVTETAIAVEESAVVSEGEAAQTSETSNVTVTAPDENGSNEVTETVDEIKVTGDEGQEGAVVDANGASAELIVKNDIQVTSAEGYATGARIVGHGAEGNASLSAGNVTVETETDKSATGITTYSAGEESKTTAAVDDIVASSAEGGASGVEAVATGTNNETTVNTGKITAEGEGSATGVSARAGNPSTNPTENKTTVITEEIVSKSSEGDATGVDAKAQGNKNTVDVTTGDISASGDEEATGILLTSQSGGRISGERDGSNNTAVVSAGNIHAAATNDGESNASYSYGNATGISGQATNKGNTVDVTAKNITAEAVTTGSSQASAYATGVSVNSNNGGNQEVSTGNIEAKASSKSEADLTQTFTSSDAIASGVNSVVGGEQSTGNTSTGSIVAEATATGGSSALADATGVSVDSYSGGKQEISTGDIEVKATSKSEYDSQRNSEFSSSGVTGVEASADGEKSELTITTGSVTAEATADGGIVIGPENSIDYTDAMGSAVSLKASKAGNISYTADGDVVLSLTQNMEERDAEETPVPVSPSPYTFEEETGTFTGNANAGLKISVVGKESEVAAVIKGNVNAESTINRPDVDEPITGSDVVGVVIGDREIGVPLSNTKAYDENGNLAYETDESGNTTYYTNGKKTHEYNAETGVLTFYREDGTKHYEEDYAQNKIYYDENGNVTNKIGDLMVTPPQASETGTANVKIEGDITSNGVALEVVPTLSGGSVNVVVEGTIKGESGAVLVNDNVNAGNFNLTVWKIDPATYTDYDENGEVANTEESYLEVMTPEGEGYRNDTDAAEELLKQVQYIIKVDPNLSNAHVDLDGTTKFTDFTGEEYDVAHEDDKVVIKISADSGYQITGAFNGEGKEETLLRDSEGNYYIVVPRGGGIYLTATVEALNQGVPEEREERNSPVRVKTTGEEKGKAPAVLDVRESNGRVAIPAVSRLLKGDDRKMLTELSPAQQLLIVLTKAGFGDAAAASGFTLSEEAKKLLDSLEVNLREAVRLIYRYENGVRVKWYYVEMNLSGNKIARFGFRQLEDGSWMVEML